MTAGDAFPGSGGDRGGDERSSSSKEWEKGRRIWRKVRSGSRVGTYKRLINTGARKLNQWKKRKGVDDGVMLLRRR